MWKYSECVLILAVCICSVDFAVAQHDRQRNATQGIAAGDFKKVEKELTKADDDDPETHFVRMMLALKQGDTASAVKWAGAALDAGLPFARLVAGPRDLLAPLYQADAYKTWAAEYGEPALLHGPMVGSVTDSSASFWVRTSRAAKVQVKIGDRISETVAASSASDFTAVAEVDGLDPATQYEYQVLIEGRPADVANARVVTFPETGKPARFSVAFGGGAGYVPQWERMWDTIRGFEPAALFMLGDNVYIDQPQHLLCQHYCYYQNRD